MTRCFSMSAAAIALAALPVAACAQDYGETAASASAPAANTKQTTMPEDPQELAFYSQAGFSEAVIHGDTVWLSGIVLGPVKEGQTEQEMYAEGLERIGRKLERAGSSWDDVLDITTYHVDIDSSLATFARAKYAYVKAPYPAWTAIGIDKLFRDDGLIEIKIVARVTPEAE